MKALSLFVFLCVSLGLTQSTPPQAAPPADEKGDTVIATFLDDGHKVTLDEYQALLQTNPKWQGQDREQVLHKYAMIRRAAAMAKSQNLQQKSPYKESLDFTILVSMADFAANEAMNAVTVEPAEIEKYYNEHKEPYKMIKVSGIKVAFGTVAPVESNSSSAMASRVPKKALTQEEAKAKAGKLVAQLRAGADFSKLVQTESDDEASKSKGGDLGTWRLTDNVPDDLRMAVLSLKEGEVSEPVLQPGGFYVVHADAITYTPLADVRDSIFAQLKQQHTQEWMQDLDKSTRIEFPAKKEPVPGAAPSGSAK